MFARLQGENMRAIVLIALCLASPAVIIALCRRFPKLDKIGVVIICYLGGIALGNSGLVDAPSAAALSTAADFLVVLGLPLLLLTIDIEEWRKLAGKALVSFLLAAVAVSAVAALGVRLIAPYVADAWKVGGMAVGVYTGGTPNLAAIKTALAVPNDTFLLVHTYDTVVSLLYILFCASLAQRLFTPALGAFVPPRTEGGAAGTAPVESITAFSGMLTRKRLPGLAAALLLAVAAVAIGFALSLAVPKDFRTAVAIIAITSLGILASFIPGVRRIEKSFQLGMYFIYAFCFTVASMVSVRSLMNVNWPLLAFIVLCIGGGFLLHGLLCKLFGIDADTFIITSVSAVCSPPFVPVVASGLKNPHVILPGITTGIIGYVIGNYLGIGVAYLLR